MIKHLHYPELIKKVSGSKPKSKLKVQYHQDPGEYILKQKIKNIKKKKKL